MVKLAAYLLTALLLTGATGSRASDDLVVYPPPPIPDIYRMHNDDFTVRARSPGGEWRDLYEYDIRVDWDHPQDASLVYFDFTGIVEIEVEKNNGGFAQASVLPRSSGAQLSRRGGLVRIVLTKPEAISVQFDDDRLHNLHILAGAPPPPRPAGKAVRYFGPGVHAPPAGADRFPIRSGETVYLAGGAILKGSFALDGVSNVTIMGRGLIYDPGKAIDLDHADHVALSDFILVNGDAAPAARVVNIRNSDTVRVEGVSGFTAGKWSDGINISTSRHVAIDHVYLRTSDDAVVVYAVTDCPACAMPNPADGPRGARPPADTFDIAVTNSTLWADVAHAMYIGHFGDNAAPRTIHDVVFDNIDVANLDEDDPAWEGAMAIYSGDSTLIRDIRFSNIRVDRIEEGKLVNIAAGANPRYNKAEGRGIENVTLRGIRFTGEGMPGSSVIAGASDRASVRGVRIEDMTIAGRAVRAAPDADIRVGRFVRGLTVR